MQNLKQSILTINKYNVLHLYVNLLFIHIYLLKYLYIKKTY